MAGDDARAGTDADGRPSLERVEELLTDRRRREALRCLYARPNPVPLPDLADRLTRREYDDPVEDRLDERLHIYMSLYHDHVPVLAAAGLVTYSQATDAVELTGLGTEPRVERAVRAALDDGDR